MSVNWQWDAPEAKGVTIEDTSEQSGGFKFLLPEEFGGTGRARQVPLKDLAWLVDNLATSQQAGLPLFRAVAMLADMRPKGAVGKLLANLRDGLADGQNLSVLAQKYRVELGFQTAALLEAGEKSGTLATTLEKARDLLESRRRTKRQVVSAMAYPIVITGLLSVLGTGAMLFVVPRFAEIYKSSNAELPFLTQLVINMSGAVPTLAVGALIAIVAFVVLWRQANSNPAMRLGRDKIIRRLPVFGNLSKKAGNARMASGISAMLGAGVPLLETLKMAGAISGSAVMEESLARVGAAVSEGASLSMAMKAQGDIFPPMFIQLVTVGEEVGELPGLAARYAKVAEEELEATTGALTDLLQPIMIVAMAVLAGGFLAALYLPMFDVTKVVHG